MGQVPNEVLFKLYESAGADVFVLPSVIGDDGSFEGIPHSLKEAMAWAVAVVATDTGGTSELIQPGSGLLVPPADANALASAIERLSASADERHRLGWAGRARVLAEFSLDETVARFAALLGGDGATRGGD